MNTLGRQAHSPSKSPERRSVSPIQHLKQQNFVSSQLNQNLLQGTPATLKKQGGGFLQTSAVQGRFSASSPDKGATEAGLWKSRCEDLESNLCQVHTDLEVANFKAKKARDLEQKVDLILKQNQQLLGENDSLGKSLNQKKTESEIWKGKYEGQLNTIISLKANYEVDLKKQGQEIARLNELLQRVNEDRYLQVEETKGKAFLESSDKVEHIKKSHAVNVQYYEEQLRKLKDCIDDRDNEIQELSYKLNNTRNDQENEQSRLNQDRDRLRGRIQQLEVELQQELENQRIKIDQQFNQQINSIKVLHRGEIETLEGELRKLKSLIEAKNEEIQSMINQNKHQKNNFDCENRELREEILNLKEKIIENNQTKEEEVNDLKEKLATLHIKDTQDLKNKHEQQEYLLNDEIQNLKQLLGKKNEELDNSNREKNKQRDAYFKENGRLKEDIDQWRYKYSELENERTQQLLEAQNHLSKTNLAHEEFTNQLKVQIEFLQNEISELKFQIVRKNNELDENINKYNTIKANLEDDLRRSRLEGQELARQLQLNDQEKYNIIEDNKQKDFNLEQNFINKIRILETERDALDKELRRTKESLSLRIEENNNLLANKRILENEIRTLKAEIDSLGDQILYLEKIKAKELQEQRLKFEESNLFAEKTLKNTHNNQVNILHQEIDRLKIHIEQKQFEIEDMINKYEIIENQFLAFQQNKEQLNDYEKKIQLIGADVVSTKNLYDVFVKSKARFSRK